MCIIQPSDGGQTPPIESILEGRHFFVVGFWGVRTINITNLIVETHSWEYNVYSRTIRQRLQTTD